MLQVQARAHPLQVEVNRRVAELIGLPAEELVAERDDCGAPTLVLQLAQMALLYAHLGGQPALPAYAGVI